MAQQQCVSQTALPVLLSHSSNGTGQALADLSNTIREEALLHPVNVNLSARKIVQLPPEIGLLIDLERIGLNNNMLTTLPPEFGRLGALRYLNLRSNLLREFPLPLTELVHLEVLDLSKNKIERFPTHPGALINLRVLSISRNRVQMLPKYVASMKLLHILKLDHNPFVWPPSKLLACVDEKNKAEWLENIRLFLLKEDPPAHLLMQNAASRSMVTPGLSSTQPPSSTTPSVNQIFDHHTSECTIAVRKYFLTSVQSLIPALSPFDCLVKDASKTFLFSVCELYDVSCTIIFYLTRSGEIGNIASSALSPPITIEREMKALDRESIQLLTVHKKLDCVYSNSANVSGFQDSAQKLQIEDNSNEIALMKNLKLLTRNLSRRVHTVINSIYSSVLPVLFNYSNPLNHLVVISILCDWHKANVGLSGAIQLVQHALLGPTGASLADNSILMSAMPSGPFISRHVNATIWSEQMDRKNTGNHTHGRNLSSASDTLIKSVYSTSESQSFACQDTIRDSQGLQTNIHTVSGKNALAPFKASPNIVSGSTLNAGYNTTLQNTLPISKTIKDDAQAINVLLTDLSYLTDSTRVICLNDTNSANEPCQNTLWNCLKSVELLVDSCKKEYEIHAELSSVILQNIFRAVAHLCIALKQRIANSDSTPFVSIAPIAARALSNVKKHLNL
ncbi:hypothetical protein O5D80_004011 [Batrachochytrium dendrobatidis]|nr:hypothetical protein O5D80_004011 [Batrachochytrium dendrobatidis]